MLGTACARGQSGSWDLLRRLGFTPKHVGDALCKPLQTLHEVGLRACRARSAPSPSPSPQAAPGWACPLPEAPRARPSAGLPGYPGLSAGELRPRHEKAALVSPISAQYQLKTLYLKMQMKPGVPMQTEGVSVGEGPDLLVFAISLGRKS